MDSGGVDGEAGATSARRLLKTRPIEEGGEGDRAHRELREGGEETGGAVKVVNGPGEVVIEGGQTLRPVILHEGVADRGAPAVQDLAVGLSACDGLVHELVQEVTGGQALVFPGARRPDATGHRGVFDDEEATVEEGEDGTKTQVSSPLLSGAEGLPLARKLVAATDGEEEDAEGGGGGSNFALEDVAEVDAAGVADEEAALRGVRLHPPLQRSGGWWL